MIKLAKYLLYKIVIPKLRRRRSAGDGQTVKPSNDPRPDHITY